MAEQRWITLCVDFSGPLMRVTLDTGADAWEDFFDVEASRREGHKVVMRVPLDVSGVPLDEIIERTDAAASELGANVKWCDATVDE